MFVQAESQQASCKTSRVEDLIAEGPIMSYLKKHSLTSGTLNLKRPRPDSEPLCSQGSLPKPNRVLILQRPCNFRGGVPLRVQLRFRVPLWG